jgi:hypothetical protein
VVAVVLGIPFGVLIGRWTWNVLVSRLGAVPVPVVSIEALALVGAGVLILANLVGLLPGLRAVRSPARTLRAE